MLAAPTAAPGESCCTHPTFY